MDDSINLTATLAPMYNIKFDKIQTQRYNIGQQFIIPMPGKNIRINNRPGLHHMSYDKDLMKDLTDIMAKDIIDEEDAKRLAAISSIK